MAVHQILVDSIVQTGDITADRDERPIQFDQLPSLGRVMSISIEYNVQVDTGGGGGPSTTDHYLWISRAELTSGSGSGAKGRNLYRLESGLRMRDLFAIQTGRIPVNDPAAIAASQSNTARQPLAVIQCRQPRARRPKDFDIPCWELKGGSLRLQTNARADVDADISNVDSYTITVLAEVDDDEDAETGVSWEVAFDSDANNTPAVPPEPVVFYAVMNTDRDHSDITGVFLRDRIENLGSRALAQLWNQRHARNMVAGSGALSVGAPETLPLVTPDVGFKVPDVPRIARPTFTRTSTDAQILAYMRLHSSVEKRAALARAYGVSHQEAMAKGAYALKLAAKNKERIATTPERAQRMAEYLPYKLSLPKLLELGGGQ